MLFDIFDDVFLLDLPLEAAKRALERFVLSYMYFSQVVSLPSVKGLPRLADGSLFP